MTLAHLLHLANALYIIAFLVKDILWLRALSIAGGTLMVTAYLARTPPMWDGAGWDALFIAVNVVQIGLLLASRRPVRLTGDEQSLYQASFRALTMREFKNLLSAGRWEEHGPGAAVVEKGRELDDVRVVLSGTVEVRDGERRLTELGRGQFVGEMAFLTGEHPAADVLAKDAVRCFAWPSAALKKMLEQEPEIRAHVQTILGHDLVRKLRTA